MKRGGETEVEEIKSLTALDVIIAILWFIACCNACVHRILW